MYIGLFIGTTFLELIVINRYFSVLFNVPDKSRGIILLSYLLAGGILFISSTSFFPVVLTGILSIGSACIIASLYPVRFESRLFFSILYLILGFIAESLSYYFILIFRLNEGAGELSKLEGRILILFISSFIMLLFILTIRFIKLGHDYQLSQIHYVIMGLINLASLIIMNTLFFYSEKNLFYILSVAGVLFTNILVIFLFDSINEKFRLADENRQLQKQIDYQYSTYEKTVHTFESIKRVIHDTNKQLLFIRECIQKNHLQEATEHINKTLKQINTPWSKISTGNLVIDALVSNALNIANNNMITMKHDIRINTADIHIDHYDLCVVIGNVLDNAIEATQLVPKVKDKFIYLQIFTDKHTLVIHISNSRQESKNQEQHTIKGNPEFHGIGLTNIRRVTEKYGGHLKTEVGNHQFDTTVILPLPDSNPRPSFSTPIKVVDSNTVK
ncbi:sensor histidine kinase [Paenibacillus macerans]|uniref:sensor histidine kinase n=1 Tax=Paenibacillus macerans TaxID=44252 RepID=UPI00203EC1C8|nr:ATP-binding protein [Paenibacillus macerans]MCM3702181.1 GHKL domain-containing protein [Paenibacillus macerans]